MKSVMQHDFSKIPAPKVQRSVFNRSHGHKTTFNAGYLVPLFIDEILPADTVSLSVTLLARLSTLLVPIMDNLFLETFFFFVPNRLLWTNWEHFNGAQDNPGDSVDYLVPSLDTTGGWTPANGSIFDYMGIPTVGRVYPSTEKINVMPLRAYNLLWNQWFRDENLQNRVTVLTTDGPDPVANYSLLQRGKRHDYFTSCLPWPQKGSSVSLPLGTTAPVVGDGQGMGMASVTASEHKVLHLRTGSIGASLHLGGSGTGNVVGAAFPGTVESNQTVVGLTTDKANSHVYADLSSATAATINQLRQAFAYQQILELDARGGTRYTEMILAHFGVHNQDFRLQRAEYLGGSSQRINVSQVQQTAQPPASGDPLGTLAAYSVTPAKSGFHRSFTEHGYIIGLVNVRADLVYQQGLNRLWSRRTRYDFYLPALAHLGEQAVLNKEIFFTSNNQATNDTVFGYQERWAEYKYYPSRVSDLMRSDVGSSLDVWHLAIDFASVPSLNASFIVDAPPLNRALAIVNDATPARQVLLDSYFSIKHARPMPVYSTPAQLGRF